jgi:hypothetical protein
MEIMGFPLKPGANKLVAAKNGEEGAKNGIGRGE